MNFSWPEDNDIDLERMFQTIQRNKEHGWVGDKPKRKSLMRTLALNFPGALDREQMEALLDLLTRHDEFR